MKITKNEFIKAFGLMKKGEEKDFDTCTIKRSDHFSGVTISVTADGQTTVIDCVNNEAEISDRSSDSTLPLNALLQANKSAELRLLFEGVLGKLKLASMANPQNDVAMGGFGNILIAHDSSSLTTPVGWAATIQSTAAMLAITKTGKQIAGELREVGAQIRVQYTADKFSFDPMTDSAAGVLHADTAVTLNYYSLRASGSQAVAAGWYLGNLATMLGHELIHAVHAYGDISAYSMRSNAHAAHDDWADLEEQLTITGVLSGKRIGISECDILAEYGYPVRWGHSQTPTMKGEIDADTLEQFYGPDWKARIR